MAEVDQVPIGGAAVEGRILAHRRDDDPVGEFEVADAKRREQRAHARSSRRTDQRRIRMRARCWCASGTSARRLFAQVDAPRHLVETNSTSTHPAARTSAPPPSFTMA